MKKVAIIGRPNVGKSTLFNRLVGKPIAIVDKMPNVTRDLLEYKVSWDKYDFLLIDTAGFSTDKDMLRDQLNVLLNKAITSADLIVFLTDGVAGLHPLDHIIYKKIKTSGKKFIIAVNKIDSSKTEYALTDFYILGGANFVGISALHGRNIDALLDNIVEYLSFDNNIKDIGEDKAEKPINIVVAGKPNVGKSSLINKIMGEERLLVTDIPGTTRDPVSLTCSYLGQTLFITDTAGYRKKSHIFKNNIEKVSYFKSIDAIEKCDICLLMINALVGLTSREIKMAGEFFDKGKAIIVVVNFWDKIEDKKQRKKAILSQIKEHLLFLDNPYVVFTSALTGENVMSVLKIAKTVYMQYAKEVKTSYLNKVLEMASKAHSAGIVGNSKTKFYYITQIGVKPPKFLIFTNSTKGVNSSYKKYLINSFRKAVSFRGIPIELHFKSKNKENNTSFLRKKKQEKIKIGDNQIYI